MLENSLLIQSRDLHSRVWVPWGWKLKGTAHSKNENQLYLATSKKLNAARCPVRAGPHLTGVFLQIAPKRCFV